MYGGGTLWSGCMVGVPGSHDWLNTIKFFVFQLYIQLFGWSSTVTVLVNTELVPPEMVSLQERDVDTHTNRFCWVLSLDKGHAG